MRMSLLNLRRAMVLTSVVLLAASTPAPLSAKSPREGSSPAPTLGETLAGLEPVAAELHQHVQTLTDPFFEGRSADTRGGHLAAEYLEFHYRKAGLKPAFQGDDGSPAYLQPFAVPGDVVVRRAAVGVSRGGGGAEAMKEGEDFNALGFSGKGQARGPLAFVGYSIDEGPSGYASYKPGEELKGAIAVILRYEPVDEKGASRWTDFDGWSRHAELMPKVAAAVTRGASGVILVNPPGVKDARSRALETAKSTRFGKPIGVPAIMISHEQAKRLLKSADVEGRDLMDLRRLADSGGHGVVAMDPEVTIDMDIDVDRARLDSNNVGAVLEGKGALAGEFIVLGAHYDHLGYGYVGGSNPNNLDRLHPGADDNASGTAALLVLARRLKERYAALEEGVSARSILFLSFGAEEMGLLGAEHFIRSGVLSNDAASLMINMDMIGRLKGDGLDLYGTGTAEEFEAILPALIAASGFEVKKHASGIGPSDHAAFHRAGLPVLAVFTGLHKDYHSPDDTAETLNYEGAARVASFVESLAMAFAERPGRLTLNQTTGLASGPGRGSARVRLGVMPGDYSGEEPGVLVGDVMENTPAQKAGILKGDRIIRWGGEELADAGSMMQRLRDHKPGDVVEVVVVREGKEVTIPVTLQGRGGSE